MNIFVLCPGRSGSMSFIKACQHITNYTSTHESRSGMIGSEHFAYPSDHIEADNRLSWLLGRLDFIYGNSAFYVHLKRDRLSTAKSFTNRYGAGIINAYATTLIKGLAPNATPLEVCLDYCDTVNSNIDAFLKDKTQKMTFRLEHAAEDFKQFWRIIEAEGNLDQALEEWKTPSNKTQSSFLKTYQIVSSGKIIKKINRIIFKLPAYIKSA